MTDLHRKLYTKFIIDILKRNIGVNPRAIFNFIKYKLSKVIRYKLNYYQPISVQFYVNRICNLKCEFCQFLSVLNPPNVNDYNLTVDRVKQFLQIPLIRNCLGINLTGGEPFLNKEIFQIIRLLKEKGYIVYVSSNGTLIEPMIEEVKASGINLLSLSLYDDDENSNVSDIINIVPKLKDSMFIKIHHIIQPNDLSHIEDVIMLAKYNGAHGVFFINYYPNTNKENVVFDDNKEYKELKDKINRCYGKKIAIHWCRGLPVDHADRKCRMPFYHIGVDALGNIAPCCVIFPNRKFGNILEPSIDYKKLTFDTRGGMKIWNNEFYTGIRKILLNDSLPVHPLCKDCTNLYEDIHGV